MRISRIDEYIFFVDSAARDDETAVTREIIE